MKTIFTIILVVLLSASLCAQAPHLFSYQAVVRDNNNKLVANKSIGMQISLLQGSENGTPLYVELHNVISSQTGLVSINIGGGAVENGSFASIDWSKGPYFVKIETDPNGGFNYLFSSTSKLLSVPYALFSENSLPGPNGEKGDIGEKGDVGEKGEVSIVSASLSPNGDTLKFVNGGSIILPAPKPIFGKGQVIKDIDGNLYNTIYIGSQQWMAENLKTTKQNLGHPIANPKDKSQWFNTSKINRSSSWLYYNFDSLNYSKYGKLYNYYAVDKNYNGNKNVCPYGWHIPSDQDWNILINYLGGIEVAGGKMKEVGFDNWTSPNTDATNSSLFAAIPSGGQVVSELGNEAYGIGETTCWWVSDSYGDVFSLNNTSGKITKLSYGGTSSGLSSGFSVRCIKD